jgi:hypothetical protein
MRQQNAGAISIQFGSLQQRAEKLRVMYSHYHPVKTH